MDYYKKYLKYKSKYLNLKNQIGGLKKCNECTLENLNDFCTKVKKIDAHTEVSSFEWTKCRDILKPNVYFPQFHSCQSDLEKIIPPGCILVNTSVCGLNAFYYN